MLTYLLDIGEELLLISTLRLYFLVYIAAQVGQPMLFNGPGNLGNLGGNEEIQPKHVKLTCLFLCVREEV